MLSEHLMELLLSGVIALVAWIFRSVTSRQKEDFDNYREEQQKRWDEARAENLRRDAAEDRRRKDQEDFISKLFMKQTEETGKLVAGFWDELRGFKEDRRRYDEETWRQINALKDRQAQFELQQAKAYHTKQELDKVLEEKLGPIKESLNELNRHVAARRFHDPRQT